MYTPPVTPWESVMPEVSDLTEREELPKAGLVPRVKSEQGSRIGSCGWITSVLRKKSKGCHVIKMSRRHQKSLPVVMRLWDTPVPIPNTMVKT